MRRQVVLPEPEGPSIEKNSPCADLEVDAVDGNDVTEALRDALEADRDARITRLDAAISHGNVAHQHPLPTRPPRTRTS